MRPFFLALLAILAAVLFAGANPPLPDYSGFLKLEWSKAEGFSADAHELRHDRSSAITERHAESEPFVLRGNLLELQVAGDLPRHAEAALIDENGDVLSRLKIPEIESPSAAPVYAPIRFSLSPGRVGAHVRLQISLAGPLTERHSISIRKRADFFHTAGTASQMFPLELVALVLIGFFIAGVLPETRAVQLAVFFMLACGFQLRTAPFYYWDEWHVLQRFAELGFPGVIYTHNEHFLPLFFGWYYLETKLVGECYLCALIISAFLHAANALLLSALLRRIGEGLPHIERAAFALACLFTASALHAETLQWAFEQTILLCQLFTFGGLIAGWEYLRTGQRRYAAATAACAISAPLCFGNGFSLCLQLPVVLLLSLRGDAKGKVVRFAGLLAAAAIFAGGAAYLYKTHQVSSGHGVEKAKPFGDLAALGEYLAVGTQAGAILRGSGLFPKLAPEDAVKAARKAGIDAAEPLAVLAFAGLLVSLLFLAFGSIRSEHRRTAARLWASGQALILACMILPALGRWQLGAGQSLSLRYHYSTLLGVAIMVLPAIAQLVEWGASRSLLRFVAPAAFASFLAANYFAAKNFDYFTGQGYEHRLYAARLADWKERLAKELPGIDFEANGTPLAGLYPVHPQTITPGRHPNDIYAVIRWLRGR